MLDILKFEYGYDLKHRLLLSLIINYYNKNYEGNKNNIMLFVADDRSQLIKMYSIIYEIIDSLKVQDIVTLRKFYQGEFKAKETIFTKLDEKDINYKSLVDGIKKEYTRNKSINIKSMDNHIVINKNINIVFATYFFTSYIQNKYLVDSIFILDSLTVHNIENKYKYAIGNFIKEYYINLTSVYDIEKNLYSKDINLKLYVYLDSTLDVVDSIILNLTVLEAKNLSKPLFIGI